LHAAATTGRHRFAADADALATGAALALVVAVALVVVVVVITLARGSSRVHDTSATTASAWSLTGA
jgi:hypothetical protein